jgi:plastocyanin
MMQRFTRTIAVTIGAATLALGVGLAGAGPASAAAPAQSSGTASVKVGDNYFKPPDLEITAGTKVTWKNEGKILHNVVAVKGKFGTKALTKGNAYSYKFKKPGTYAYYCSFHGSPTGGQHGKITVVAAPPPTTVPTTAPAG